MPLLQYAQAMRGSPSPRALNAPALSNLLLCLEVLSPSRVSSFARRKENRFCALFLALLALALLPFWLVEAPDQVAFPEGLDAGSSTVLGVQLLQSLLLLLLEHLAFLLDLGVLLEKQSVFLCQQGQLGLLLGIGSINLLILSLAREHIPGTAIVRAFSSSSLYIPR